MKINHSNNFMLSFVWLLIALHLWVVCDASRRIFDTIIISENSNTFDCLIKPEPAKDLINYKHILRIASDFTEIRQYCRRVTLPNSHEIFSMENSTMTKHPAFTFDHLRSMGITYQQLYKWYAPTDLIEEYIAGTQTGLFFNCSYTLWFGSKCEYTFDSDENLFSVIDHRFNAKEFIPTDLSLYTNGTCYEMNNTDCESIICLDWREICDGKIDCKNGYDERHCQELEMNECNSTTERRCYDGQCIDDPLDFRWLKSRCLELHEDENIHCFKHHEIDCENLKCPKLFFSCGDGYFYDGPSIGNKSCPTQRDRRYLERMPSLPSLILFSHVIINYTNTQPKYICYNQTLCPYFSFDNYKTTIYNNGLTCHAFKAFTNRTYNQFDEMVKDVKRLLRSCSLLPLEHNDLHNTCSLFRCDDGSKCLSFHRLSDGIADCTNGEDERQTDVCSHNLTGRFICDNGTKCMVQQIIYDQKNHCMDSTDENFLVNIFTNCSHPFSNECDRMALMPDHYYVRFYYICNGLVEYAADLNNNTDESDCLMTEWSCDAYYSKCDGVWNCPDGRDELGCNFISASSLYCNNSEHFCLQINTGDRMCLSTMKINDGNIDCIGSFDEREFCRSKHRFESKRRYHCRNSTECIYINCICDGKQDCPENDDETTACSWFYNGQTAYDSLGNKYCDRFRSIDYDGGLDLFCDLGDAKDFDRWETHQIKTRALIATEHRVKRQSTENFAYDVIWSCNRGIYIRSTKDPEGFACFCPDHYYGHRCQYQRKRISISLQMEMSTAFNYQISTSTFVVLLVHTNQSKMTIISHVQFLYIVQYECDFGLTIQLLYPMDEPYRSLTNNSIHIHMIDRKTLRQQKSWNFPLSFEFLPVQHLFKRLDFPELDINIESKKISIPYNSCTSCSNNSLYIGHDVSLGRDIYVCPLNYDGRRCLLPFDPCTNTSCNGHGTCEPTGIYYELDDEFICLCDLGWFARDLTFLSSTIAFLHSVDTIRDPDLIIHSIYLQRFQKETLNITFIIDNLNRLPDIAFIQFYEHQSKFDYYFLHYRTLDQKPIERTIYEVQSFHRCRPIHELFDADILAQPYIRRVKNYQQPCRQHQYHKDIIFCFYDDDLMCICRTNYTTCVKFQTNLNTCDKEWCNGRGTCVKDNKLCPTYSRCICEQCAYGSTCQFSTAGYSLSLDGIIGSHILLSASTLSQQSKVVQTSVILIIIIVVLGIILNIPSISTFIQKETHEVGCGLYLLASSIMGLLTMIILICKMILLLTHKQNNASCSAVEFFLKWCPTSCEWLNAGVAFERAIAVKRATQYSRSKSKYFSKWMTPIILILVGCIYIPEFFFRGIIIDPFDNRTWCVLTLNSEQPGLLITYSILNIFSFIIPLLINLSSGIIIVLATLESKQKTKQNQTSIKPNARWRIDFELIRTQVLKHKHILIGPVVLGLLSLPRLVLTFIFVCTKLDQNSIPSLLAYLVGFLPSMTIIFAFVWPSQAYRAALIKSIKMIVPNYVQNLFTRRN